MFSINSEQHSKILGFALIAYAFQFFFGALRVPKVLSGERLYSEPFSFHFLLYPFDGYFIEFWYFIIAMISGILIISSKGKGKYFSLFFVFLTLSYFPLGTILSFYTLCYLFVISKDKNIEEKLSKETQ